MKGREKTPEEKAQIKKERAEIELRRKVNREVRKRKLEEDAEKKASKKKAKATTNNKKPAATAKSAKGKGKTKGGAKAGATKPPRTYFGHVPKPAEDGGPPPLPELPPGGWDTSDRKTRIEAARRAADYYSRMAQKWEEIAQGKFGFRGFKSVFTIRSVMFLEAQPALIFIIFTHRGRRCRER